MADKKPTQEELDIARKAGERDAASKGPTTLGIVSALIAPFVFETKEELKEYKKGAGTD